MTQTVLLGDIADVLNGAAFSSRDFISVDHAKAGDLPVFKMGNLSIGGGLRQGKDDYIPKDKLVKLQRQITQPNDILMCMTDMKSSMNLLGYSGQIRDELYAVNQRVGIIRPKAEAVSPQFLYYYMNSPDYIYRLRATANSGVQVNLSTSAIRNSEIVLPSLEEQERVADIVGTIDEKIELNRQMNETLEQMGQSLFRHYFVDNPEAERWNDGIMGDIIVNFDSKRKPVSSRQRAEMRGEYRYFGATSVMDYVNDYLFDGKYLLLAEDGSVIKGDGTPYLQYVWGKFWVNNHAHILQAKDPYTVEYLYLLLSQSNVQSLVSGAVQLKINQRAMNNFRVKLPPHNLVKEFCEKIDPMFAQRRKNEDEIQSLTALRDTLLPRLISGKVKV